MYRGTLPFSHEQLCNRRPILKRELWILSVLFVLFPHKWPFAGGPGFLLPFQKFGLYFYAGTWVRKGSFTSPFNYITFKLVCIELVRMSLHSTTGSSSLQLWICVVGHLKSLQIRLCPQNNIVSFIWFDQLLNINRHKLAFHIANYSIAMSTVQLICNPAKLL